MNMPQSKSICVLKKRSEFLAVAAVRQRWVASPFIMQVAPRSESADERGLGLTASKKMIGNAVARNRARRRLRALAHLVLPQHATAGYNYVFIARPDCLTADFDALRKELEKALKRLKLWQEGAVS